MNGVIIRPEAWSAGQSSLRYGGELVSWQLAAYSRTIMTGGQDTAELDNWES